MMKNIRLLRVTQTLTYPLRKHVYLNILKITPPKTESFSDKNSDIFCISEAVLTSTHSLCF